MLLLLFTVSLARKRKLRENYTLLWLFISLVLFLIIGEYKMLTGLAGIFGASPNSLLTFCGFVALLLLILQLSIMNSYQAMQIKNLTQKISLLEQKFYQNSLLKIKNKVKISS